MIEQASHHNQRAMQAPQRHRHKTSLLNPTPCLTFLLKSLLPQHHREPPCSSAYPRRRGWPPPPMSSSTQTPQPTLPLPLPLPLPPSSIKQNTAWQRQKGRRHRRSKSVTDEDVDELKACIELGFGFDSPEMDQRLSDTFPAYGMFYSVNKQYHDAVSKPQYATCHASPTPSECDTASPSGSPLTIFGPGDNPQTVKTRLRQWAQMVACAVRQSPS